MSWRVIPVGGIPIYIGKLSQDLTDLEYKTLIELPEMLTANGTGNYISQSKQILNIPDFKNLKLLLKKYLDYYTKDILQIKNDFKITDSWSTRNPKGTRHIKHSHGNSIFSGVYYVDAKSGDLEFFFDSIFSKNFNFDYDIEVYNNLNSNTWKLSPKSGDLVLFPSWVNHEVSDNFHTDDRRIIGFNSFVSGKFGNDNTVDNLKVETL